MILDWITKNRCWVIIGCAIIIIFTIIVEAFSNQIWSAAILRYFQHWSLALSAGATLALAYIAYIAILENRRVREEDRVLHHKLEALDEIRDWAHQTLLLAFSAYNPNEEWRRKVRALFSVQSLTGASILTAAGLFDEEMVKKVSATQDPLLKFERVINDAEALKDKTTINELQDKLFELLIVVYDHRIQLLPSSEIYTKWRNKTPPAST